MQLVVDTNILISFFRENPVRFIILNSGLIDLKLLIPDRVIEELIKNKPDILKYSKLNSSQFDEALSNLTTFIEVVPNNLFKQYGPMAKKLIHEKDIPMFALALKLNCPIWSNEPAFKEQFSVKIFNTSELRKFLNIL